MQNAENKTKKYVLLATYVLAVLCLLAGLFLPFFNDKDVLALQLFDAFKCLLNKGDPTAKYHFTLPYQVSLFGIESIKFDFMALIVVIYAVVCALALLSFIPVAFSIRKGGKSAKKFYYAVETAAIIILSLYFTAVLNMLIARENVPPYISSIPYYYVATVGFNMLIALGGTTLALLALCGLDKRKISVVKIIFFLLSAIGFIALFDVALFSKDLAARLDGKITSAMAGDASGVEFLNVLFAAKISDSLSMLPDAKNKALFLLGAITATVVLINFFIDTVKLGTGKDGKVRQIANISRYGLEFAAALCVLITALICEVNIGIMLIVILAVATARLAVSVSRFVMCVVKKRSGVTSEESANNTEDNAAENAVIDEPETEPYAFKDEDFIETEQYSDGEYTAVVDKDGYSAPTDDDGYTAPEANEVNGEPDYEPVYEPVNNEEQTESVEETPVEEPEEIKPAEEEFEDTDDYEPVTEETYVIPVEETPAEEPEEVVELQPAPEQPAEVEEPVRETEEPAAEEKPETEEFEELEEPAESEPVEKEPEQKPYHEEIKPYNPYEKHNNPFRAYEQSSQPVQPYNPYVPQPVKPAQPVNEKPAQPARTAYEQKPVQPYKPYEQPAEKPPVRPLQPRPIIQEFKPVPPISEQPPKETHVYTIDTIYAGPTDEFIHKLSNDERIEFAKTFIEKNRGNLGNIPDYVVGGDNKKFFSVAFIYLGRIRGLVSDGLLNKMYKELNML